MILWDALANGALLYPDRVALVGETMQRTYAELIDRVDRLASLLNALGAAPGARVAVLVPNGPALIEVMLACARLGAAVIPLNHRLIGPEIAFQITDAEASIAVVHPNFAPLAGQSGLLDLPHVMLDEELDGRLAHLERFAGERPQRDAVLIQLYTSGTTGTPKGCLLTQANWIAAATSFAHAYSINGSDVVLTMLPLFHVAGLSWVFSALLVGGTVVIPERFEPQSFWEAVVRHKVTILAAPFGVVPALRHPAARESAATVRMMVGAPSRLVANVAPHVEMVSGYGATELCGQVIAARGADLLRNPCSIGRLMIGCGANIVDGDGRTVAQGETGELLICGPNTTGGYWQRPEANAELLSGGWLHTGDLVRIDADGLFYFVDRIKDMIKTGGENVYSAEVEAVLLAHPQVGEVAVFGVPDDRWGQAVKAEVVIKGEGDDHPALAAALDAWCLERLAPYKRPRWFGFTSALPRNATGKIVKPLLIGAHDPAKSIRRDER